MTTRLFSIFCFLFFNSTLVSQEYVKLCPHKLAIASDYLSDFGFASYDMVHEINESISRCDDNSANADFVFGMLGRFYAKNEQDKEVAFRRIERAAQNNHAVAAKTLALMLKEGEGCVLNLEASEDWLKKAYKLGNDEAAYILGYYYLKGLGTIRQSYPKAVRWFKRSRYPMATHWLALCQYFGFGEIQNKEKALTLLKENGIDNSLFFYDYLIQEEKDSTEVGFKNSLIEHIEKEHINTEYIDTETDGLGTPKEAYLIAWDWSKEHILQQIPISFNVVVDSTQTYYTYADEKQAFDGSATLLGDQAGFDGFSIAIPNPYPDHEIEKDLFVDIFTVQFSQALVDNTPVVLGELEGWVANFNEPAPPLSLLLVDPWNGLLQHERNALQPDKQNIISNYPNQFTTDLVVRFELAQQEEVQVNIYHFSKMEKYELLSQQPLAAGEHIIRKDTSGWPGGLYVIQLFAGDQLHRKLILKKY